MKITGGCHCRAISFTAEIDPATVLACHCTDCQALSGAPFRVVVPAPMATFHLTGAPKVYLKVAESGNRRAQAFCGACGSPIYGAAAENPTAVGLRAGCIDQRAELRPRRQIWRHSAMPWLEDLDQVPGIQREK